MGSGAGRSYALVQFNSHANGARKRKWRESLGCAANLWLEFNPLGSTDHISGGGDCMNASEQDVFSKHVAIVVRCSVEKQIPRHPTGCPSPRHTTLTARHAPTPSAHAAESSPLPPSDPLTPPTLFGHNRSPGRSRTILGSAVPSLASAVAPQRHSPPPPRPKVESLRIWRAGPYERRPASGRSSLSLFRKDGGVLKARWQTTE